MQPSRYWAGLFGILICLIGYAPAHAAGNQQEGKSLAEERCVNCHVVGRNAPNAIESQPVGPDFTSMKKVNVGKLKAMLKKPHPVMSKFPDLSDQQISDLAAYIALMAQ